MKLQDMTTEDLDLYIEQKLLEFFGDPDAVLNLKSKFKDNLLKRLNQKHKRYSHEDVIQINMR
ncbi:hypothetical protein MCHI_003312 [Candidatus Magnetoovum chiemensis]|nr:hypothetical protein MCHI_003312 [Candidatus Magnetoovum chiemensis]